MPIYRVTLHDWSKKVYTVQAENEQQALLAVGYTTLEPDDEDGDSTIEANELDEEEASLTRFREGIEDEEEEGEEDV